MSRLINEDASKFDIMNVLKFFFMSSDVFFITAPSNGIPEREIGVMDFKGFSWWHLMKIVANLSTIRGFMRYIQVRVIKFKTFKLNLDNFYTGSSAIQNSPEPLHQLLTNSQQGYDSHQTIRQQRFIWSHALSHRRLWVTLRICSQGNFTQRVRRQCRSNREVFQK